MTNKITTPQAAIAEAARLAHRHGVPNLARAIRSLVDWVQPEAECRKTAAVAKAYGILFATPTAIADPRSAAIAEARDTLELVLSPAERARGVREAAEASGTNERKRVRRRAHPKP